MSYTKNCILLLCGQGVSILGSSMHAFGMGIYMLAVRESAICFARSLALILLAKAIFIYFSEDIARRVDNKKLIIMMDLISGLVVLLLLTLSRLDELRAIYTCVTAFTLSACNTIFSTTMRQSVRCIVKENDVDKMSLALQRITYIAAITAPLIGGVLFELTNIEVFLLINGLSFIVSALSQIFMTFNKEVELAMAYEYVPLKEVATRGIKGIRKSYLLKEVLVTKLLFNLCMVVGIVVAIPYTLVCVKAYRPYQYGIIQVAFPLGIFIGAWIVKYRRHSVASRLKIKYFTRCSYLLVGALACMNYIWSGSASSLVYTSITICLYMLVGIIYESIELPIGRLIDKQITYEERNNVKKVITMLQLGVGAITVFLVGVLVDYFSPNKLMLISSLGLILLTNIFNKQVSKVKDEDAIYSSQIDIDSSQVAG